jgi:EAL domain-containing protein (putative c-di-GMP-specific phosphodiesterase class I)
MPHARLDSPLARVLALGGLRALYQPVVELESAAVVGYEALARGPEGSELQRPDLLFQAARREGRLAELHWRCREVAYKGALDAGLRPPTAVFVNVEPETLRVPTPTWARRALDRARTELRVIHEISERGLVARPAQMLRVAEELRGEGWGIAIDGFGRERASLALLPLVRPDVVKLDRSLIAEPATADIEHVGRAVRAYREWADASVIAEGIETPAHIGRALALGATLGQGWLFGRAGELAPGPRSAAAAATALGGRQPPIAEETPFEVAERMLPMEVATKSELLAMSMDLEYRMLESSDAVVVLASFQAAQHFTPATARRYAALTRTAALVAAFGAGLPPRPAPGVTGVSLPGSHRLAGEWSVLCVGPHFAGALVARDLGDEGPNSERRFRFLNTRDRDVVVHAARALGLAITSLGSGGGKLAA